MHEFAIWRKELRKVTDVGAAISFQRNLETEDRRIEPVRGAEVSATAFTIMGRQHCAGAPSRRGTSSRVSRR